MDIEQSGPEKEDDSMPEFSGEESELDDLGHDGHLMEGPSDTLSTPSKPRSSINAPPLLGPSSRDTLQSLGSEVISPELHTCPICSKQLKTDNQGLNAHIDFCLSKGAILEAQAEASTPKKPGQKQTIFNGRGL